MVIDGNTATFRQGPQILCSENVPIVVETLFKPFNFFYWVPWVHYVPVKRDLSDLIENIEWLKANDDKAREIGLNGKALCPMLYDINNIVDDASISFNEYARLMTYEPEAPDDKFLWKKVDDRFNMWWGDEQLDKDDEDFDEESEDEEAEHWGDL
jgi:hypothetical protein